MLATIGSLRLNAFAFPIEALFLVCYREKAIADLRRAKSGKLERVLRKVRVETEEARGGRKHSNSAGSAADSSHLRILQTFAYLFFELSQKLFNS